MLTKFANMANKNPNFLVDSYVLRQKLKALKPLIPRIPEDVCLKLMDRLKEWTDKWKSSPFKNVSKEVAPTVL